MNIKKISFFTWWMLFIIIFAIWLWNTKTQNPENLQIKNLYSQKAEIVVVKRQLLQQQKIISQQLESQNDKIHSIDESLKKLINWEQPEAQTWQIDFNHLQ